MTIPLSSSLQRLFCGGIAALALGACAHQPPAPPAASQVAPTPVTPDVSAPPSGFSVMYGWR